MVKAISLTPDSPFGTRSLSATRVPEPSLTNVSVMTPLLFVLLAVEIFVKICDITFAVGLRQKFSKQQNSC